MNNHQELLAIVPARAGSKGVTRKNIRSLNGTPLFAHTVRSIQNSGIATRLVISTDDEVIKGWAILHGIECIDRPAEFALAESTISEVALHLVTVLGWTGNVGIFQPTSPLRSGNSTANAYETFLASKADSLSSCVRDSHLYWYSEEGILSQATPLFSKRENRQYAKQALFQETGAIQFSTCESLISNRSIVGKNHALFEISTDESEDIDTVSDLRRVQEICDRGLVIFRLTANKTVGSGHLFHCLQLAEQLDHHKILFVLKNCDDFVAELLREQGRDFEIEIELEDLLRSYASFEKKIVVNDILDTERAEILLEKFYGFKVLNIEDLGDGAKYADLVVNALYHQTSASPDSKTLSGPRYATLRPEFHDLPSKNIAIRASRLLVTFGGTDPAKLTHRVSRVASQIPDLQITAILGIGAEDILPIEGVTIRRNVKNMALEMHSSDLVITAAGRTVFEAAATGTPVLSIAQNARESTHSHLDIESGVVFLGIGEEISDLEIKSAIERLIENTALRVELSNKIVQLVDTKGVQRIANHIETLMKELH